MNQVIPAGEYEREITAVDSSALAIISRQEIDVQISTAHRFPRSITAFRNDAGSMATLNDAVAAECSYALPRDGKVIEGPSVRFAEILLSSWGNCRAAARVVNEEGNFITAQGMFHDLQKNSAVVFEVRKRITNKHGKRYNDDMIITAGNAAASIALRNAILKGVPKALWHDLWEQARKVAMGDHKTLSNRRAEALKVFQSYGVSGEQLMAFLQVRGVEEITTDHLLTLRSLATAFKEGDTTPEQVFADVAVDRTPTKPQQAKPIAERLDQFARDGEPDSQVPADTAQDDPAEPEAIPPQSMASAESAPSEQRAPAAPDGADTPPEMPGKIKDAMERGRGARRDGFPREVPKGYHYTSRKAEADAFLAGWDEENFELKAAESGTV